MKSLKELELELMDVFQQSTLLILSQVKLLQLKEKRLLLRLLEKSKKLVLMKLKCVQYLLVRRQVEFVLSVTVVT